MGEIFQEKVAFKQDKKSSQGWPRERRERRVPSKDNPTLFLTFTSGPTRVTTAQQELFISNPPYPLENLEMLELISCWNVCTFQALMPLPYNLNSLRERERKANGLHSEKLKSSLWTVEDTCWSDCQSQQKCRATFLSPFQERRPKLPSNPNREWRSWKGHAISSPVKKTDFLSFLSGWKCNISVCNFNFTADWHLQGQRILIKSQKHLIQWLADGERVCSNSIFLIMLTKHGMCFSNALTLFHLQFKSDN